MAAEPPKSRLQIMLQAAVQNIQWTYILFWQLCPQQGILVWSDGYYNGPIKTRKTVQPTEVTTEEATLQRSQQLRELYESLSAGETSHQVRRPSAALSPEDLTESEWFYLMCVSFSFPPGVGLPGKAYVKRRHIWLTRANEADSKVFSRSILAKSARIQTVLCIPLLDGVVELGTTERVEEDIGLIQRVKTFFQNPNPPRPALSEHSTSNPDPTSSGAGFHSPATLPSYTPMQPTFGNSHVAEDDEENEDVADSGSEAEMSRGDVRNSTLAGAGSAHLAAGEPIELMHIYMSKDIRLGSPQDDGSNNLNSDFNILAVSQPGNTTEHHRDGWPVKDPMSVGLHPPHSGNFPSSEHEDTHYSQTVSAILENQSLRWSKHSSTTATSPAASAFTNWITAPSASSTHRHSLLLNGAAQWALKYILFTVPFLHTKSRDHTARKWAPPHEVGATHVLAERRRREKLNERFIILRSLVPFVTKMDKISILGDTIEYVKQLRKKIQELEAEKRGPTSGREKRKMRIVEDGGGGEGGAKAKAVEWPPGVAAAEVSIIESDALVEIQCLHKEGLLLDVMKVLREFRIEVMTVQSSVSNGVFAAELRAKVKENVNGKKTSIMEVKKSINQILR